MKDSCFKDHASDCDCSHSEAVYFVDGGQVEKVLEEVGRAYLVGHLSRFQPGLNHVGNLASPIEVGVSKYDNPTIDQPHLHQWNTDITVVLDGMFAVRIIATGETQIVKPGGACVIEPGCAHVCVASANTRVLFVKSPGGNDKQLVKLDEASRRWAENALEGYLEA